MKVTVTKQPDGSLYMTKDGHGELFAKDVKVGGAAARFGDNTLELVEAPLRADVPEPVLVLVRFSYVDYLDTANRDVPGDGVRHTWEREVPGRFDFGPYTVEVE